MTPSTKDGSLSVRKTISIGIPENKGREQTSKFHVVVALEFLYGHSEELDMWEVEVTDRSSDGARFKNLQVPNDTWDRRKVKRVVNNRRLKIITWRHEKTYARRWKISPGGTC